MGFVGCIPRFIKDHLNWILSGLGCAGLIGTNVLTAKAAPVAKEALWKASADKIAKNLPGMDISEVYTAIDDEYLVPEELTLWEKTKVLAKHYWPSALTGLGTIGCIVGGQMVSTKQIAGLVAAYGTLAMQFDQYRGAIRDEYGEEADKKALILAQAELKRTKALMAEMAAKNGPFLYGMAWMPGVIFEAEPRDVENALMHWNRNLCLRGCNDLAELNEFLDIPKMCWDEKEYEQYGYNQFEDEVKYGVGYVDFEVFELETPNGPVKILYTPSVTPYRLDIDYSFEGDPTDPKNVCPMYNMPLAIERAKKIGANDIIQTAHPAEHYPVYCLG